MPGCEDFGHEFLRKWSLLRGVNPPDFLGETGTRMVDIIIQYNFAYCITIIYINKSKARQCNPAVCQLKCCLDRRLRSFSTVPPWTVSISCNYFVHPDALINADCGCEVLKPHPPCPPRQGTSGHLRIAAFRMTCKTLDSPKVFITLSVGLASINWHMTAGFDAGPVFCGNALHGWKRSTPRAENLAYLCTLKCSKDSRKDSRNWDRSLGLLEVLGFCQVQFYDAKSCQHVLVAGNNLRSEQDPTEPGFRTYHATRCYATIMHH